jgi:hypothetical protein
MPVEMLCMLEGKVFICFRKNAVPLAITTQYKIQEVIYAFGKNRAVCISGSHRGFRQ